MSEKLAQSGILFAITEIAKRNASKYSFAYFEHEDIQQEIQYKCLSIMPTFSGTNLSDAFAFFNTCSQNYLKNLQRDNYVRIVPPCMPGGFGANLRPGKKGCKYWCKESPKSDPCSLKLYNECAAWKNYQGYVQRLLNAANPITISEEILKRTVPSSEIYVNMEIDIREQLGSKLIPYFEKLMAGEKIPNGIKHQIQMVASGVIYE